MRHIIPISGKDSLATAIVQTELNPSIEYEYIFSSTEMELPETIDWLSSLEKTLDITIQRVGESLLDLIRKFGFLPSHRRRYCTKWSKIKPMEALIKSVDEEAILYVGLRADEKGRTGYISGNDNISACYPLQQMGIDLDAVYELLYSRGLMPPTFFWPELYEAVVAEIGSEWKSKLKPWQFDKIFAGRSRNNCFMCFYQQRVEWVWLLQKHPELFKAAESIENEVGVADWRENFYFIGQGFPLSRIKERKDRYFTDKVKQTVKLIQLVIKQGLFDDSSFVEIDAGRSCGLFCGK